MNTLFRRIYTSYVLMMSCVLLISCYRQIFNSPIIFPNFNKNSLVLSQSFIPLLIYSNLSSTVESDIIKLKEVP